MRLTRVLTAALISVAAAGAPPAAADPAAPGDFVVLQDLAPDILADIRYVTAHNFTGTPIAGYHAPLCILTRPAAEALARAQQNFVERGYTLKVYDCYRPQQAVDDFVRWAQDVPDQRMKSEFYPRVDKSTLFADGYIAARSGHSRGSTVDLTLTALPPAQTPHYVPGQPLVDCAAPQPLRFPDNSIDMGTGFDCFDPLANTADPRISGDAVKNRQLLLEGLQEQGFVNYDKEWWHFTYSPATYSPATDSPVADSSEAHSSEAHSSKAHSSVGTGEPYPDTFFDFPVDRSALSSAHP